MLRSARLFALRSSMSDLFTAKSPWSHMCGSETAGLTSANIRIWMASNVYFPARCRGLSSADVLFFHSGWSISSVYIVIPASDAGLCGAVTRGCKKGNGMKSGVMFVGSSPDRSATQPSAAELAPENLLTSVSWVDVLTLTTIH
jgi:hypothetical protein